MSQSQGDCPGLSSWNPQERCQVGATEQLGHEDTKGLHLSLLITSGSQEAHKASRVPFLNDAYCPAGGSRPSPAWERVWGGTSSDHKPLLSRGHRGRWGVSVLSVHPTLSLIPSPAGISLQRLPSSNSCLTVTALSQGSKWRRTSRVLSLTFSSPLPLPRQHLHHGLLSMIQKLLQR